ncbi:MAG: peptidylprolyl isomerase [Eubacteriales bacterium]
MSNPKIKINVEGFGTMCAELYPEIAPATVENFLGLVKNHFFDGLIFHRVIPGFMIQGGGFDTDFNHKDANSIKGEFTANGFKNDLKHERGVLSMARTSAPNSASSQFFIMHARAPHLDGQYAGFGKVFEGLDVIDKIANVPTTTKMWMYQDCPRKDVVISSIEIIEE